MGKKRGVSRVFEKKILSDCTKLFRWRTVWCFRKIPLSENFLNRRGGGGSSPFYRIFLSHRTETKILAKEPFCFPEKVWFRKNLTDARGHITLFSGNCHLTVPKKFVGEHFGSSEKIG